VRRIVIVLGLSATHLIVTLIGVVIAFSLGMERFDHGSEPELFERTLRIVVDVLVFPLFYLPREIKGSSNAIEWFLVLANSFLWGVCLYLIGTVARRLYHGH
jgi:hypothetical protein